MTPSGGTTLCAFDPFPRGSGTVSAQLRRFLHPFAIGLCVIALLLGGSRAALAQSAVTGGIAGLVTDSSGAIVPNASVSIVKPAGAFYVLANISKLGLTSQNFADRLLSKANVAVVPGIAFGDDRTVRLSYATSLDVIKKGMDRFEEFCRTL